MNHDCTILPNVNNKVFALFSNFTNGGLHGSEDFITHNDNLIFISADCLNSFHRSSLRKHPSTQVEDSCTLLGNLPTRMPTHHRSA